ncbi:hypothetical protein OG535_40705 [Kitasatospora sp. NBC_00085]|uniref:hypothetical protein n=1 Tax=unclassified Kitasatospora TaxID=2633591 RepID=UPI0032508C59
MEAQDDFETPLRALAGSPRVYSSWGPASGTEVAQQVLDLVQTADAQWGHQAHEGARGPTSPAEIAAVLDQIDTADAVELMTNLATFDLVMPGIALQDRNNAHRAARRVAEFLGEETRWFTNVEGPWHNGRMWSPVTRHGIDVVVAGTNTHVFTVLLAFGND